MSPQFVLLLLVAGLVALIPVWRLRGAGWPRSWLAGIWAALALAILIVLAFPAPARFLIPLLILAFLAPFVAGPERLTRLLQAREPRGVIIDVTPRLPALPHDPPDDALDDGPNDPNDPNDPDRPAGAAPSRG